MSTNNVEEDFWPETYIFPRLPEISDEKLKKRVFIHRSFHGEAAHLFEENIDSPRDYERLEHLGDAVLKFQVTRLLYELYPLLNVGPASAICSRVLSNKCFASISLKYKLPNRLKAHPSQVENLRQTRSIQADLFEAYVGALYLGSHSLDNWFKNLFKPLIQKQYLRQRQIHPVVPNSEEDTLIKFNRLYHKGPDDFDYKRVNAGGGKVVWYATVKAEGKQFKSGPCDTKISARREAARNALIDLEKVTEGVVANKTSSSIKQPGHQMSRTIPKSDPIIVSPGPLPLKVVEPTTPTIVHPKPPIKSVESQIVPNTGQPSVGHSTSWEGRPIPSLHSTLQNRSPIHKSAFSSAHLDTETSTEGLYAQMRKGKGWYEYVLDGLNSFGEEIIYLLFDGVAFLFLCLEKIVKLVKNILIICFYMFMGIVGLILVGSIICRFSEGCQINRF